MACFGHQDGLLVKPVRSLNRVERWTLLLNDLNCEGHGPVWYDLESDLA